MVSRTSASFTICGPHLLTKATYDERPVARLWASLATNGKCAEIVMCDDDRPIPCQDKMESAIYKKLEGSDRQISTLK